MKIQLNLIGKTKDAYLREGISMYEKRIQHYIKLDIQELKVRKANKRELQVSSENEALLKGVLHSDFVIALDEKGKALSSIKFSKKIEQIQNSSKHRIVFIIGGAYGLNTTVLQRADLCLSLSEMTMTHDMVRLLLLEQIYRAMTILNNHPYHNE